MTVSPTPVSVRETESMFRSASAFNQALSAWDVPYCGYLLLCDYFEYSLVKPCGILILAFGTDYVTLMKSARYVYFVYMT
eukprot:scaffold30133_cov43-Attheya_sp.AAC.1